MRKTMEKICRMSQMELKDFAARELTKTHKEIYVDDGFVYAQGTFPVLLIAHLDTVHEQLPQSFCYDEEKGILSSPQGVGGDDRCGVYMALEVVKKFHCSVLFCEDEEIRNVGAKKFLNNKLSEGLEFNYMIEFDRHGRNDAVFYNCANPEFEKFITQDYFETAIGTCADISSLAPAMGCAAVNLSTGEYAPHTLEEYVVLSEMQDCIDAACDILARTGDEDKFIYIEAAPMA